MNKKALIIGGSAIAVVAVVVALILIFTGSSDAYRSIKVFEIDGTCKVDRDGDSLDAFKNMALSSGDSLTVGDGSFARLKLDDDKYVYLEANTKINLTATGTANDSKTMVYIERGSMLTEVKKKLSATSSYDIVTPNTTMSIRGTKTLTEVYEDVLGAIKTNAAVVEGQVSFKTIQKDSTGKAVIVTTDLSVGQGLGVTTDSKNLLSQEDVKHIADDGKTVDGQTAEETTHEELGTTLETPVFSEDFLTNIVAVLARSREEDIEEGFTAEDVTEEELNAAINVLNDVIDGKVEIPAAIEEYVVSQTQPYYEEPIVYDTPVTGANNDTTTQPQVENEPEQIADDTVVPEDTEGEGDDTFVVDGTGETLVGIVDDTDDNDAVVADDESDDEDDAADDEADKTDEDGSDETEEDDNAGEDEADDETADESDEDDASDEDAEDGEEESDDKSDEDGEEDAGDESDGDEASDEESEEREEQPEQATDQPSSTSDAQEPESSAVTDPNATDERVPSGGGTSDPNSGTDQSVNLSYGSTTAYVPSSTNTSTPVTLSFYEERTPAGSSYPERNTIEQGNLPTTLTVGAPLPGTQGSDIHVDLYDTEMAKRYEFAGWYKTERGAMELTSSDRVETAQSGNLTLYPGVRAKTFKLRFTNLFPAAGKLDYREGSFMTTEGRTLTYETVEGDEGNVITVDGFMYGDTFKLPVIGDGNQNFELSSYGYDAHEHPNFVGIGTVDDVNIAKYLLDKKYNSDNQAYAQQIASVFYPYDFDENDHYGTNSEITVTSDQRFYLYFAFEVDLRTSNPYMLEGDITWKVGTGTEYVSMADLLDTQTSNWVVNTLISDGSDTVSIDDQYWGFSTNGTNYYMLTYYYGKPLDIPSFKTEKQGTLLGVDANYKLLRDGNPNEFIRFERAYNDGSEGSTIAKRISGAGRTSGLPLSDPSDGSNRGRIDYGTLSYNLMTGKYTVFELGDDSVTYQIGDMAMYINERDISSKRQIKTFFMGTETSGTTVYNKFQIPLDRYNDYSTGEDRHEDSNFIDAVGQGITLSKEEYKIIGFDVRTSPSDPGQSILIDSEQEKTYGKISKAVSYSGNSYYFISINAQYDPSQVTVSPIFAPLKPFDVKLTRAEGTVNKREGDSPNWAWEGYELEISGPGLVVPEGGAPFVTYIQTNDLKPYQRETTYYPVDNSQQELQLFNGIKWDVTDREFVIDGNGTVVTRTTSEDKSTATLKLKLKDLFNANGNSWKDANSQGYAGVHYLEYLTYFNSNGDVKFNTCYNNEQMQDGWCAVNVTGVESGYKPYKNYKADILADSNMFTGIVNTDNNGGPANIVAVLNERTDSFEAGLAALKAFSGYTDERMFRYGGTLTNSGKYSRSDFGGYNIISKAGGNAGTIINGNAGPGHGLLSYGTINTVFIKANDLGDNEYALPENVYMYNSEEYEFNESNQIIRKASSQEEPKCLDELDVGIDDNNHYAILSIALTDDLMAEVPNGWTLVNVNSGLYYINYTVYGNTVEIANKSAHNG